MPISSHPFLHDPNILRFPVVVHGRTFHVDLVADTYIDPDSITTEYAKQPALLAWYGVIYQQASNAYENAKTELDIFEARACGEVRKLIDKKEKVTETFIKQYVMADEDYVSRRHAVDELHAQADLAKRAFEAIKEKGSALVSLGAHIRSEVESLGRDYLRTKGGA
jgi:hypothetical protein